MAEILSQNEIDALLSAVESSDLSEEKPAEALGSKTLDGVHVSNYDFKRPERVSKDQIRALENMHEGFARNFGAAMSGYMRSIVDCRLSVVDQLTYSEFIQSLPNPTCFNVMTAEGLEGKMVLELNPSIVFPVIDKILGGGVEESPVPDRPMTDIEGRLIGRITKQVVDVLSATWRPIGDITFKLDGLPEPNPQIASVALPNSSCILITFELRLGDVTGLMNICIPYNVIETVMSAFSAVQSWFAYGDGAKDSNSKKVIERSVQNAKLPVRTFLAETSFTMRDLLDLSVGDLITTKKGVDEPLLMTIEGRPKFFGRAGTFRGHKALWIENEAEPDDRI